MKKTLSLVARLCLPVLLFSASLLPAMEEDGYQLKILFYKEKASAVIMNSNVP